MSATHEFHLTRTCCGDFRSLRRHARSVTSTIGAVALILAAAACSGDKGTTQPGDTAPSALVYSTNPAIYTKGQAIANNTPSGSGGPVASYAISAGFNATGLTFSTITGVISGTPTALSSSAGYTVTATNAGGSTTATVTITVNDVAPSALVYSANPATYIRGQAITSSTPTSAGGPVTSYAISASFTATGLTFNTATGVISGTPTALSTATGYTVTATNSGGSTTATVTITVNDGAPTALVYSTNPAVYTKGQAIANNTPTNGGGAVTSYAISAGFSATGLTFNTTTGVISGTPTTLSVATGYTVTATNATASTTATVTITVNDVAPSVLAYTTNPAVYTKGQVIAINSPTSHGGPVTSYAISAGFTATGLSFSTTTGLISGTPTALSTATADTVTATNSGGSTIAIVTITVNDLAPSGLVYSANPVTYLQGQPITSNVPVSGGGPVTSYAISPAFFSTGLSFSTTSGIISGTPTAPSTATGYLVTATNSGGTTGTTVTITVTAAPAGPGPGDVAVNIGGTSLAKLKAADGTLSWGPVAGSNCGGIGVDPLDFGVYFGNTANCLTGGSAGVFKYNSAGVQAWNSTGVMTCGSGAGFYIANGGVAVDVTSSTPGVVLTMSGFFGNFGKVSRTDGHQIWCNASNDLGRPSTNPATGQSYAITNEGNAGYNTMYTNTAAGSQTSTAVLCEGFTDLNPADGSFYNGGNAAPSGCGLVLYEMNPGTGIPQWSINLVGIITSFEALAVQPWNGGWVFAMSTASSKIVVIDPNTRSVVTSFSTLASPTSLAVSPAGGNVYVASSSGQVVSAYSPRGTLLWTSPSLGGGVSSLATVRNTIGLPDSSATINGPATVPAGSTGISAAVLSQSGATYAWTITGGTITGSSSSNQVTFNAGTGSSVTVRVTVTSAGGIVATGARTITLF